MNLLDHINIVPNFPKEGINFYDLQSLLQKPDIWRYVIDETTKLSENANADIILGIESRGFLTGVPVAANLNLPFGMIRKKGKLPGQTIEQSYALEYGQDTIEIQETLLKPGMKAVILDDLLATGGTMRASIDLVRKSGATVALTSCLIELYELGGAEKIDAPFTSLLKAPLDP